LAQPYNATNGIPGDWLTLSQNFNLARVGQSNRNLAHEAHQRAPVSFIREGAGNVAGTDGSSAAARSHKLQHRPLDLTFVHPAPIEPIAQACDSQIKVFCFFFSKKKALP